MIQNDRALYNDLTDLKNKFRGNDEYLNSCGIELYSLVSLIDSYNLNIDLYDILESYYDIHNYDVTINFYDDLLYDYPNSVNIASINNQLLNVSSNDCYIYVDDDSNVHVITVEFLNLIIDDIIQKRAVH